MTKTTAPQSPTRVPWACGRIIGPKPPLEPKHIWAIRTRLQHDGHVRDLAMFNVAIDSRLRGCDLVKLRVSDVHLGEGVRLRTTIVQQKTSRPEPFEMTEASGLDIDQQSDALARPEPVGQDDGGRLQASRLSSPSQPSRLRLARPCYPRERDSRAR